MKRRKRVYPLKTCLPSGNTYAPAKTWLVRVNRTKTWLTKVKTCLSRENVPRKDGNAFYREKRRKQRRKSISRANTRLYSENALTGGKIFNRAKTSLAKRRFAIENVARKGGNAFTFLTKAKTRLPSENLPRKGEKAFIEGKRLSQTRNRFTERRRRSQMQKRFYVAKITFLNAKMRLPREKAISEQKPNGNVFSELKLRSKSLRRFYRAKTSLAQSKMRLPSEKCVNQAKSQTQMRKCVFRPEMFSKYTFAFARKVFARLWSFRSIDAFSPFHTLFSLGKSVFDFPIEA